MFPQDGQVELIWDIPSSGSVSSYQVDYVSVDTEYNETGSLTSDATTDTGLVIESLNNEFSYK